MAYTLGNNCAKNLCKRTVLLQFIIKSVVTCFFGTQCSMHLLCVDATGRGVRVSARCLENYCRYLLSAWSTYSVKFTITIRLELYAQLQLFYSNNKPFICSESVFCSRSYSLELSWCPHPFS